MIEQGPPESRPLIVQTECDMFPCWKILRDIVQSAGFRYEGIPTGNDELVVERARYADGIVVLGFNASSSFINGLERCKVIARCGVGMDNVDVERAHERGIVVTHVPDFCTAEVAEHALALILACERRIALCDRSIRAERWPRYSELAPMRRVEGLTVGIIGFGRIGRRLSKLVRGIGMRAIAHDPYLTDDPVGAELELLLAEELLPQADFLSLHLPLTANTRHWLDAAKLALLPAGATVVNTARGGVVDEVALLAALESGAIRAAGLDVFEGEPDGINRDLATHPNVVATPHSAALSEQSLEELFRSAAEDVVRVLKKERAVHQVAVGNVAP